MASYRAGLRFRYWIPSSAMIVLARVYAGIHATEATMTAVDRLGYKVPPVPSFTNDVFPILQRALRYQWVTTKIGNKHAEISADIPPPATTDRHPGQVGLR